VSESLGTVGHPAPRRHHVAGWRLLFGLLAAPAAWWAHTTLSYLLASRACYPHDVPLSAPMLPALQLVLVAAAIAAVLIAIAGWFASYQAWRATREQIQDSGGHHAVEVGEGRTRFFALAGMMVSSLFVAAIVFNALGVFVLPPCAGR
jgi:hypothetical protein